MGVVDVRVCSFARDLTSPRKAKYGGGKSSTSAVLGHSTFTMPRRAPPAAPVSGSMVPSGQIAPRMKLVRRASRDLSADIQARIENTIASIVCRQIRLKHGSKTLLAISRQTYSGNVFGQLCNPRPSSPTHTCTTFVPGTELWKQMEH